MFQIGELANGLSVEFIKEFNKMPWKQIIGMRNRIVHGYDTINFEIVWRTAIESIPELNFRLRFFCAISDFYIITKSCIM